MMYKEQAIGLNCSGSKQNTQLYTMVANQTIISKKRLLPALLFSAQKISNPQW